MTSSRFIRLKDLQNFDHRNIPDVTFQHDMIPIDTDDCVEELRFDNIGRIYQHIRTKRKYYSVTTLLSNTKRKKDAEILQNWINTVGPDRAEEIKNAASRRGNHIHDTAEQYLLNDPNYQKKIGRFRVQWNKFKPILNNITLVRALEIPLYSDILGVAGRVDCIGSYKGVPGIIDFKTSSKAKTDDMIFDYCLQCTMYSLMLEERYGIRLDDIFILMVIQKSQFCKVFHKKRQDFLQPLAERVKQFRKLINPGVFQFA